MLAPLTDGTEQLTDSATHPVVVWITIAVACVVAVVLAVSRVAEPISTAWAKVREARQRNEDARIKDLSAQVDHLAGRIFTLEERQRRQDTYLYAHAMWDQKVIEACIKAGMDIDDIGLPPPLRPPLDAP